MKNSVKRFEITTRDGLTLRGEVFGDRVSKGTPVICLPGLTRNSRDFYPLAEHLSEDPDNPRFVMILNSRGRGPSDYDKDPKNYDIMIESADVIDALAAAGLPEAIFIGTSRGGLLTMAIAAFRPNIIAGAVLNDIGAEVDSMGISRIKTYLNKAKPVNDWEDAIAFVKMANYGHFPVLTEENWEQFAQMTFRDVDGKPAKDYDVAIAEGLDAVDLSQPLPDAWPQFLAMSHCPVLIMRGENSDILRKDTVKEMMERHPDCQFYEAKGQGHAPLFLVDEVNERVSNFLKEVDAKRQAEMPNTTPHWLSSDEITYLPDDKDEQQTEPVA